jgi:Peptidase inhibitor I78 family
MATPARLFAVLLVSLMVSACVEPAIDLQVPVEPMPIEQCNAAVLQGLVGQPGRVLNGMRFATDVRVIQPGMAVTMDFQPNRLNIWIAEGDVIERVTCG